MKRFVVPIALSASLLLVLSSSDAFAQCCGGGKASLKAGAAKAAKGGDGIKGAKAESCPGCVAGKMCAGCEAKAAQGGDGVKDAKAKKSCPGCVAGGKMCARCEKAALGGEGVKAAKGEKAKTGCAVCASGRACAGCTVKKAAKAAKAGDTAAKAKPVFLGNKTCPIMGGKVDPKQFVAYKDPETKTHANIYTCCAGCIDKVKKDPAAAYKKAYLGKEVKNAKTGKVIAKKGEPIPVKNANCPIMGGKVSPTSFLVYNGYKVGLCCPGCDKAFMKDADKNLAKLFTKKEGKK